MIFKYSRVGALYVSGTVHFIHCHVFLPDLVDRGLKRRQVKPLAASLLDALDYDSSDDSDFEVGDASGIPQHVSFLTLQLTWSLLLLLPPSSCALV